MMTTALDMPALADLPALPFEGGASSAAAPAPAASSKRALENTSRMDRQPSTPPAVRPPPREPALTQLSPEELASGDPLPFTRAKSAVQQPPGRPVMFVGAREQGTPLAYPPTPFTGAKEAAPADPTPPAPLPATARTGTAPPPPMQHAALLLPQPAGTGFAPPPVSAPPARYDLPSYERERVQAELALDAPPHQRGTRQSAPPQPKPEPRIEGLTLAEFVALRAELWSRLPERRAILRSRGLSELRWRVAERQWGREIDDLAADPERLANAVSQIVARPARAERAGSLTP